MEATITPQDLANLRERDASLTLIDVRTPPEFDAMHVPWAKNVPLDQLTLEALRAAGCTTQHTLYVICRSGSRGKQACQRLASFGCAQVVNVAGGTLAWDAAGLPLDRGLPSMPLDRQVRVVIGSLVVFGAVLALAVDVRWSWLAAAMGAGLIYAGLTDDCPMANLVAKMPWNRGQRATGEGPRCTTG
ncbi:MAG: rhodanese-like domain-containing protein [Pirellulales bacterium]|nr:rhodanese-like domain-containing protein [Pirellulales bacterium]